MQELVRPLADNEKILVANELEKLFAFQDRSLGKEKKALLIQEIGTMGIPAGALIKGIRSLMADDLKTIKLADIRDSALKFVFDVHESVACGDCGQSGIIVMADEKRRLFSLACSCRNGIRAKTGLGLAYWAGQDLQISPRVGVMTRVG